LAFALSSVIRDQSLGFRILLASLLDPVQAFLHRMPHSLEILSYIADEIECFVDFVRALEPGTMVLSFTIVVEDLRGRREGFGDVGLQTILGGANLYLAWMIRDFKVSLPSP
jgi:hypothetical protein